MSKSGAEEYWLRCIREWYPELSTRTYFLPPLHFNRILYNVENIAGETVLLSCTAEDKSIKNRPHSSSDPVKRVSKLRRCQSYSLWPNLQDIEPPKVSDSDAREDKSRQCVLHCLHALADNSEPPEVMMVISQLQFGKYLRNPIHQAALHLLPRPSNIDLPQPVYNYYQRGVFDVLIIHRNLGLITLEIKSVGANFHQRGLTVEEQNTILRKKVKEAIAQMNKTETVLKHLVSDLAPVTIRKTLVLPNIESKQLLSMARQNPHVETELYHCLQTQCVEDAVKLCLLSDQLHGENNDWKLNDIQSWWQQFVGVCQSPTPLTQSQYEVLISRFCGPATTVEVYCVTQPRLQIRTEWEGVSETGERMSLLVLLPEQVALLNRSPQRVFLTGPPGTGKTVVLILQALSWLQRGKNVHVLSTWSASRAVTFVIVHQLQQSMKAWLITESESRPQVVHNEFDNDESEKEFVRIMKAIPNHPVCIITDEAGPEVRMKFARFCDTLTTEIPTVHLWAAALNHKIKPSGFEIVILTTPLRSPPVVTTEVMKAHEIQIKDVYEYVIQNDFLPTHGPVVRWLKHAVGNVDHTGEMPHDCVECGRQIARLLRELNIGRTGNKNGPPPLQYRDVLILCDIRPPDDRVDSTRTLALTDIGLIQGLRGGHVPLCTVDRGDENAIREMAIRLKDVVTVAHWDDVRGLERKVVVVEYIHKESENDQYFRLHHMSRCSSQLIVIDYSP